MYLNTCLVHSVVCTDDVYIIIMPIEEVSINANDKTSIPAKLLDREEYWYRDRDLLY